MKRYQWKAKDKEGVFFISNFYHKQGIVMLDAVHLAQKECDFTLFANGLKKYKEYADAINLRYCDLGVLPQSDYYEWVASTKLLLTTFSSGAFAFCAEALALGVSAIVSPAVADDFSFSSRLRDILVVKDISDSCKIAEKIVGVLELSAQRYKKLLEECYKTVLGDREEN